MNVKSKNLLEENKAFCVLPWLHLHVMPDSSVIPCCVSPYQDIYGNVSTDPVEEIWNNDRFKQLRLQMIKGELPAGCAHCHMVEKAGFQSLRNTSNQRFQNEVPMMLMNTSANGHYAELKLKYIDIRFSNLCNFKCRGCSPTLSSSWYEDHNLLYNYKSDKPKVSNIATDSPEFWARFQELVMDSQEIYFGGGEPLITKEHFDLLRLLIAKGKTNVRLSYNTNLSTLTYGNHNLTDLWSQFKEVALGISLDDIGPRAEYFRNGTKWNIVHSNLLKLRDDFKNISRYVNVTVSSMNIFYLPELYEYLISEKIIDNSGFNINLLLDPVELRADILPLEVKNKIKEKLSLFSQKLLKDGHPKSANDFINIINQMMKTDNSHLFEGFKERTKKLDHIRGESFEKVYPELSALMGPL